MPKIRKNEKATPTKISSMLKRKKTYDFLNCDFSYLNKGILVCMGLLLHLLEYQNYVQLINLKVINMVN